MCSQLTDCSMKGANPEMQSAVGCRPAKSDAAPFMFREAVSLFITIVLSLDLSATSQDMLRFVVQGDIIRLLFRTASCVA